MQNKLTESKTVNDPIILYKVKMFSLYICDRTIAMKYVVSK